MWPDGTSCVQTRRATAALQVQTRQWPGFKIPPALGGIAPQLDTIKKQCVEKNALALDDPVIIATVHRFKDTGCPDAFIIVSYRMLSVHYRCAELIEIIPLNAGSRTSVLAHAPPLFTIISKEPFGWQAQLEEPLY